MQPDQPQHCELCHHIGPLRPTAHGANVCCVDGDACDLRQLIRLQTSAAERYESARRHHAALRLWSQGHFVVFKIPHWDELLNRLSDGALVAQAQAANYYEEATFLADQIRSHRR